MEASNRAGLKGDTDSRKSRFVGTIARAFIQMGRLKGKKTGDTEKREDKCRNKFPEQA